MCSRAFHDAIGASGPANGISSISSAGLTTRHRCGTRRRDSTLRVTKHFTYKYGEERYVKSDYLSPRNGGITTASTFKIQPSFPCVTADFPFITYYLINKQSTDPIDFYNEVQCAALRKFDPRDLRYAASHTLDLFNEVATIARPPLEPPGGRPPIPSTGYIVSIFKVFEGDDGLKFEQNWLYWTGKRLCVYHCNT